MHDVTVMLRHLLRNAMAHDDDPYAPGLRVLALVMQKMKNGRMG